MGAAYEAVVALDSSVVMQTYARKPVMFVRGEGMRLYDDEGREYLDFVSGIGAVNLGHAHPGVTRALCDQAAKLVHVSNLYYVEHRAELADDVVALLGGGMRVFFANSGTEATEGAIKLARRWASDHKPGAYKVVTLERSFHGRTLAALAATGQASKQEAFKPLPEGFVHVPANDVAALDAVLDDTVAAVMVEIVQGEGGVWPLTAEYVGACRRLCDERSALFMVDEVQTGFFRTGPAFAHQAFGVTRVDQLQHADDLPFRRAQRLGEDRPGAVPRLVVEAPVERVRRVGWNCIRVVYRHGLAGLRHVSGDGAIADSDLAALERQRDRIVLRDHEPQRPPRLGEPAMMSSPMPHGSGADAPPSGTGGASGGVGIAALQLAVFIQHLGIGDEAEQGHPRTSEAFVAAKDQTMRRAKRA